MAGPARRRGACLAMAAGIALFCAPGPAVGDTAPLRPSFGLVPLYPKDVLCSGVTSPFGDPADLDGSLREAPHAGIDLGDAGDVVIAPADGLVLAVWEVRHPWGRDWNLLLAHNPADLGLPASAVVYLTEFDHLQRRDMAGIAVGDRLRRGDRIGIVGHPGDNPQFRAEVHMEVYEVPAASRDAFTWHENDGFRYWLNPAAELMDPLRLMASDGAADGERGVPVTPFHSDRDYSRFKGFTYPLLCRSPS